MNLVPNGSFEEYWECPTNPGAVGDNQLERCKHWYKPSSATTDYYNACQTDETTGVSVPNNWFGYQEPFDGNAYVGLGTYVDDFSGGAEYIQCELLESLEPCINYSFTMYVNLGNSCSRATKAFGARFDETAIEKSGVFEFYGFELPCHVCTQEEITDTLNWVLISGIYLANGGEKYLTIGRFLDTNLYSNSNVPYTEVDCDSCFVQNTAHYYVDLISLEKIDTDYEHQSVPNVLTSNNDGVNEFWYPKGICFESWSCQILNRWGNEVFNFQEVDNGWNGKDNAGNNLIEGVYYYIIRNKEKKQTGFIQLVR